ncbi:hypothetical protein [Streptomyces sp. NPDC046887]|uniref:hypothetical protein n=1 Tax=Streptomyces sp. NPDC046887 TaxID=3155472 RepID=UPI0033DA87BF
MSLETDETPAGQIAAVVRVMDERLRQIGRLVLRAHTNERLELPGPGRYLLAGHTPWGAELRAELDTAEWVGWVRLAVDPQSGTQAPGGEALPHLRLYWPGREGPVSRWWPSSSFGWLPVARQGSSGPGSWILEAPGPEGLRVLTVVPEGGEVRLVPLLGPAGPAGPDAPGAASPPLPPGFGPPHPAAPGWAAVPPPGTALTLLGYLHRGSMDEAAALAEAVISAHGPSPDDLPDPLTALAVGRLLLAVSDPRRDRWIEALVETSPFRTDARVLAWEVARRTEGADAVEAADRARRAAREAPPLLADHHERLVRALDWAALVTGDQDGEGDLRRELLRGYAAVPGLFTTYTGLGPDAPQPADRTRIVDRTLAARPGTPLPRLPSTPDNASPFPEFTSGAAWGPVAARHGGPVPMGPPADEDEDPPDFRAVHSLPPAPAVIAMSRFASATDPDAPDPEPADWATGDGRLTGTVSPQSGRQALLTVRTTAARPPAPPPGVPLAAVTVSEGGRGPLTLLVPLAAEESEAEADRLAGEVVFPLSGSGAGFVAVDPALRQAGELTEREVTAIGASFAAATLRGQNLWRQVARALPPDHPVRTEVIAEIRRQSWGDGAS